MKFKINNIEWEIKETDVETMNNESKKYDVNNEQKKKKYYFGLCVYPTATIYINNIMNEGQKRRILMHELTHCWIFNNTYFKDKYDEEDLCETISMASDWVNEIVNKYFEKK